LRFTLETVRASFDPATFARGLSYARSGRVVRLDVSANGRIEASVRGTSAVPYEVAIEWHAGARRLHGICDCPMIRNCKHAAAAAILAAEGGTRDAADGAVDSWLQAITAQRFESSEPRREHVLYVLDVRESYYVPRVDLIPRIATLLKNGERSMGRTIDLSILAQGTGRYATPIDRTIGRLASVCGLTGLGTLNPKLFATLLDLLLATGRAHWHSPSTPPLRRADVDDAKFAWRIDASDGRQRAGIDGRKSARLLPSDPLWYADPETNAAGTIDLGIAAELASALALAPSLNANQARRAHTMWHRIPIAHAVPPPQSDVRLRVVERDPIVHLWLRGNEPQTAVADLTFAYGDTTVRPDETKFEFAETNVQGVVTTWPRRLAFEAAARATLAEHGLQPIAWPRGQFTASERSWVQFVDDGVEALRERGWQIDIDPSFPYEIVHIDDAAWDAEVVESANRWFELDIGIDLDGTRVSLLPVVVDALQTLGVHSMEQLTAELSGAHARPLYGRLPNGAFAALPPERIGRIVSTLVELFDAPLTKEGRLELTPAHVAGIEGLEAVVPMRWSAATQPLRAALTELTSAQPEPIALPGTFKGALRAYQTHGVAWLQLLRRFGFGGVLADDMGLGKTVQFLAHLAIEKAHGRLRGPVLIVAPTSVLPNWRAEIARFVPHLRVVSLTGNDRAERYARLELSDVALTSYALLHRDADKLTAREWEMVVLDEAQFVKNPRSKGAQAAAQLRASQRLALTGTPIENHLDELWSIFNFAIPGLLGDRTKFARVFRTPIEKRGDTQRRALLAARLRPFLLRRTKEDVALDLPEKTEIVTRVELDGAQRDLYETIRLAMHERVRAEMRRRGLARSRIVVLDALLKLRQVCCDPRLVKLPAARNVHGSSKLEALFEMLPELIDEGRRVLLFSQFTSMLDLIKPELDEREIDYVEIRGTTKDRETPVRRFQSREVPLFLISLKAGGTGLNLTAADTVIHYDPWWNPAVERQATDRAHRIGQHKPVFVYKLITVGTVEERILELQQRKGALAAGIFDDAAAAAQLLDESEIERLFRAEPARTAG
jgi:superfamily II DNA or RNA helicase